ncbi:hypothetical protein Clacol_005558 [Clathrus columnatus]|uniref:Uncharacterized protein n=1 Tax=Clathrus columnatus TaxID=1419009 RepID=A0AAV5A9N6_9AGAM|nr:hypothetical protein Clacol_005558 [Clathrus columnatus]
MGRPLYSTLLATRRAADQAATQPSPPPATPAETEHPVIEKWSRWNSFDPDSEEFFLGQDAVYEAFLTEEEIVAREEAQRFERARRVTDVLVRQENPNEGQPSSGFWADGDVNNHVDSPRPTTHTIDGSEALTENLSPSLPRNSTDGDNQSPANTLARPSDAPPSTVLGNRTLEPSQSIPVMSSSRNSFPVPNTPARISGFFSPRRRITTIGLGTTPVPRHVDIRIIPAPEPLIS